MAKKVTVSIIKCDVGSLAGHHMVPKPLFDIAEKNLKQAAKEGIINNFYVFNAGDDLELSWRTNRASKTKTFINLRGKPSRRPQIKLFN